LVSSAATVLNHQAALVTEDRQRRLGLDDERKSADSDPADVQAGLAPEDRDGNRLSTRASPHDYWSCVQNGGAI
jgi:hypothetical protein